MFLHRSLIPKLSNLKKIKINLKRPNQHVRALSSKAKLFLHPSPNQEIVKHEEQTIEELPPMPPHFIHDSYNLFIEKKNHLRMIQDYVKDVIGMDFKDWEQVQQAFTHHDHYDIKNTNSILNKLGEKVLRYVLSSELAKMDDKLSKTPWFIPLNIKNLTRLKKFDEIDRHLKFSFYIRRKNEKKSSNDLSLITSKVILSFIAVIYVQHGEKDAREFINKYFLTTNFETGEKYYPLKVRTNINWK